MMTLQHSALTVLALAEKRRCTVDDTRCVRKTARFEKELINKLPWVLMPDAIRAFIGPRQISHFEEHPESGASSWIEFPDSETLQQLTKENAASLVRTRVAGIYPKCVIGEETIIDEFARHNFGHKYYSSMLCHLLQDKCLDEILREEMVDVTYRFKDVFIIRHSGEVIDGAELRKQVAIFEQLGFIKLVGLVYEKTGVLLNREWFEGTLFPALQKAYPEALAANTIKYMAISDELNERLNRHEFKLTDEDKASCKLTDQLDEVLNLMYAEAYMLTKQHI